MKVLLVIHGYPPRYNAGSEVYTQTLAHGLTDYGVKVTVFAREEDPFRPDYHLREETDQMRSEISVYLANHPRSNTRFRNSEMDTVFLNVLRKVKPDVVHFGHLSHLSTGLVEVASDFGAKIVFTLHDYWLMCPRGQFLQWGLTPDEPWKLCHGQDDMKCAEKCYNRFVTGLDEDKGVEYWTGWIHDRMTHIRKMCELVDLFLAPSKHLMQRYIMEFGINKNRIQYLDYGFQRQRLQGRKRKQEDRFVFGYIGRHHPSKGIDHLIRAFSDLNRDSLLRIWGRSEGQFIASLKRLCEESGISVDDIQWFDEYPNEEIVAQVFDWCDCIVVPSIWDENSPLVIHEAQQAGVPVITADHGGMREYVKDRINGFTFKHRDIVDLRRVMQYAVDHQDELVILGKRGYFYSDDGSIPSIESHLDDVLSYYLSLLDSDIRSRGIKT